MRTELQRYLDAELAREQLPANLRGEAELWDEVLDEVAVRERAPAELEHRVMLALPHRPAWSWRDVLAGLWQPRYVSVRPLPAMAAAGVVIAILLVLPFEPRAPESAAVADATPAAVPEIVYVQFVLAAPGARSVSVAGDFNGWTAAAHPLVDVGGGGVWRGVVAVPAGVHKYMFVIDGEEWVTDPGAERYVDDGFGMRNALISVTPPARSS